MAFFAERRLDRFFSGRKRKAYFVLLHKNRGLYSKNITPLSVLRLQRSSLTSIMIALFVFTPTTHFAEIVARWV